MRVTRRGCIRSRRLLAPREAAASYDRALEDVVLDVALLGLGPDGHTASLFPGSSALEEREALAVSAPAGLAPWVDRVTMTVPMLSAARTVVFLVVGADKAEAARRAFVEEPSPATPASLVRSAEGRTIAISIATRRSSFDEPCPESTCSAAALEHGYVPSPSEHQPPSISAMCVVVSPFWPCGPFSGRGYVLARSPPPANANRSAVA